MFEVDIDPQQVGDQYFAVVRYTHGDIDAFNTRKVKGSWHDSFQ